MKLTKEIFNHVMEDEGRYANDEADAGGETYCGIARKHHPDWSGWGQIDTAKEEGRNMSGDVLFLEMQTDLFAFYETYWEKVRAHLVDNEALAYQFYQLAVTTPKGAMWSLQGTCWDSLSIDGTESTFVDGFYGKGTQAAIDELNEKMANDHFFAAEVSAAYCMRRCLYYCDSARRRPENQKFLAGWIMRSIRNWQEAQELGRE